MFSEAVPEAGLGLDRSPSVRSGLSASPKLANVYGRAVCHSSLDRSKASAVYKRAVRLEASLLLLLARKKFPTEWPMF